MKKYTYIERLVGFFVLGLLVTQMAWAGEEAALAPAAANSTQVANSTQAMPGAVATLAAAEGSCECPKLSCDSQCEIEQDLTFYSEKCAGGSRVMSCSRPTCIKIENAPASCGQPKTAGAAAKPAEPVREVASVPANESAVIGRIKFVEGEVKKIVSSKDKTLLNVGDEVRERDRIATEANSKAQILFNSGNLLNITPNSEIIISEAGDSIPNSDKKKMILDLIRGKVRNKVNQKYDGQQSFYRVRVGAAVAGVRGTDFAVSLDDDGTNVVSKIETLEGTVELSDEAFAQKSSITKGEGGSFVASKAGMALHDDSAAKGYLTPIYKMTDDQIDELDRSTNFALLDGGKKKVAKEVRNKAKEDFICANPAAPLNHCSWSCENNPGGEKKCRTDLPEVSCVRRICNANGSWSESTRLPSSYHEACQADRTVVKPCDY